MPNPTLMPSPRQRFVDNIGQPLANGMVFTFAAGTSTPLVTYQDPAGEVPHKNPIRLDARGEATIYWAGNYRVDVRSAEGIQLRGYPVDNFNTDTIGIDGIFGGLGLQNGAASVGFILGKGSSIKTDLQAKGRERPSLLDFMTAAQRADVIGNIGSIDVSAAVQSAIDAYVDLDAPAGTYLINKPIRVTTDLTLRGTKKKTIYRKTSTTTDVITRTYTDGAGVVQTLTWDEPAVFNLVCPNDSYLIDVHIEGACFDLPTNGTVGAFNAKRVAYSSFKNMFCNASSFFAKGYDMFQITWQDIRTRFSKKHFDLDRGTSHQFTTVACDLKNASGGIGFALKNLYYTSLDNCAADALDSCYEIDNSQVTMTGCGAESFSRLLRVSNGSTVKTVGGSLAVYRNAGLTGAFTPYDIRGANTRVSIDGTWLGVANPSVGGTSTYEKMAITDGAQVVVSGGTRAPVELGASWWYVDGADSSLALNDAGGMRYINRFGPSINNGPANRKPFEVTKTIDAGSSQSILKIDNATYGDSCWGKIELWLFNDYNPDFGFCGYQLYAFSAFKETTTAQNLSKAADSVTPTNTSGFALGTLTAAFVRNGDNTIDLQLTVPAPFGSTRVTAVVTYMNQSGGNQKVASITGV